MSFCGEVRAFAYGRSGMMKFQWDDRKRQSNIEKHGFDFADAFRIFNSPVLVDLDERENYGEDRLVGIGFLDG